MYRKFGARSRLWEPMYAGPGIPSRRSLSLRLLSLERISRIIAAEMISKAIELAITRWPYSISRSPVERREHVSLEGHRGQKHSLPNAQ